MTTRSGKQGTILIVVAQLILVGVLAMISRDTANALLAENGPIETLSAAGYVAAAAYLVWSSRKNPDRVYLLSSFFLILFALRELDFHDRFTSRGITMLRFYTSPDVPIVEKLVVVLVLAMIAAALFLLVSEVIRRARAGWRPRIPVVTAILLIPIAIGFDRLVRILVFDNEINADATIAFLSFAMEETIELAIPALFLLATVNSVSSRRHEQTNSR